MNGYFDLGDVRAERYFFGIAGFLGLLIAWLLPDSEDHSAFKIVVIWQLQTLLPIALVIASHLLIVKRGYFLRLGQLTQLCVSGVIGASLFSPLALCIDLFWLGEPMPQSIWLEWLDEYCSVVPPIVLTWLVINVPWLIGYRLKKEGVRCSVDTGFDDGCVGTVSESYSGTRTIFYDLLPPDIGRDIVYMQAQLHYLKVVTVVGESLILFGLKEAAESFGNDTGFMCHRSYWVSRNHIVKFSKQGRQGVVILDSQVKIPVSRRKLVDFSAWLEAHPGSEDADRSPLSSKHGDHSALQLELK